VIASKEINTMIKNNGIGNGILEKLQGLKGSQGPQGSKEEPAAGQGDPKDQLQAAIEAIVQQALQEALSGLGGGGKAAAEPSKQA
jgi:hypothetical protein